MNLAVSFSGGRTSAVMTKLILDQRDQFDDVVVVFCNTGQEHAATYDFIRDCDEIFGFGTVWLEAVVHEGRTGTTHRVVDYDTADRSGEPFEAMIGKYGIPNMAWPHCTRELKQRPFNSFVRSLGWEDYKVAIGIRVDEADRINADRKFIYPMVRKGITKQMVNAEVSRWPFDLEIPNDAHGNCVWCWKKSERKLLTLVRSNPEYFDFPRRMEVLYGGDEQRRFFRQSLSVDDLFQRARSSFTEYRDEVQYGVFDHLDIGSACGESCEAFTDELEP